MSWLTRIGEAVSVLAADAGPTVLGIQAQGQLSSTLSNPQPWLSEMFAGGTSHAGQLVNVATAERFTAVAACTNLLESSVGQIRCELMRRTKDNGAEPATDHPLYELMHSAPNPEMTSQELFELSMNGLLYRGNSFRQIVRDNGARVVEINPLFPDWVKMKRDAVTGALVYEYQQPGAYREFRSNEIWRTIGHTRDGITGISAISQNRHSIGLALAAEEHGSKLFSNGAQIATAFTTPGIMSEEAYKRLKDSISAKYASSANAFKTILLEEGTQVQKLGMSSVDAQYIELRQFQIEEICRIFNVPPHKIQHLLRATFNNIEHLTQDFLTSSLMPWLVRFEQTAYRDLLLPNERKRLFFRFDTSQFFRADAAARATFYGSMIANRVMNPNECRRMEGMNPYDGGDKYENPAITAGDASTKPAQPNQPIPSTQKAA